MNGVRNREVRRSRDKSKQFIDKSGKTEKIIHYTEKLTIASDVQDASLINTDQYGWALVIDGEIQLAMADERQYHDELARLAIQARLKSNIVILGGGDGCLVRTILERKQELDITVVDWDTKLVDFFDSGAGSHIFNTWGFTKRCFVDRRDYRLVDLPPRIGLLIVDLTDIATVFAELSDWTARSESASIYLGSDIIPNEAAMSLPWRDGELVELTIPSFGGVSYIYHFQGSEPR